jgi:hypothetical protein
MYTKFWPKNNKVIDNGGRRWRSWEDNIRMHLREEG